MTITAKGQVTIPQSLRKRYRLKPGTQIDFVPQSDTAISLVVKHLAPAKDAFATWLEKAAGSARTRLTTDEIMAITRGED